MARDLDDYAKQYALLPFEDTQAAFRRRLVLDRIAVHKPRRLLEIGCGRLPLFTDLDGVESTVVEPTTVFADGARELARGRSGITILESYAEQLLDPPVDAPRVDMIVVSCLLHEVDDAQVLLAAVTRQCGPDTVVHVNVPNARSLHRLLAVSMGLMEMPSEKSETQRVMQQRATYDRSTLDSEIARSGLTVIDRGSLFVKPFTHSQMQQLVDIGFLTSSMLEGLGRLSEVLPEVGSEIWIDAKFQGGYG